MVTQSLDIVKLANENAGQWNNWSMEQLANGKALANETTSQ